MWSKGSPLLSVLFLSPSHPLRGFLIHSARLVLISGTPPFCLDYFFLSFSLSFFFAIFISPPVFLRSSAFVSLTQQSLAGCSPGSHGGEQQMLGDSAKEQGENRITLRDAASRQQHHPRPAVRCLRWSTARQGLRCLAPRGGGGQRPTGCQTFPCPPVCSCPLLANAALLSAAIPPPGPGASAGSSHRLCLSALQAPPGDACVRPDGRRSPWVA